METDKASSEEQASVAQPDSAKRIEAPRAKRALFQFTVVDAQGQHRSGVPVTLKRTIKGSTDIDETVETDAFGQATIWLTEISSAETLKLIVAGQEERTIAANTIDPEALVSIKLPLKPDAPVKGSLSKRIEPRREYSPPLARILASENQYVTVPHTKSCDVPVPATQASSDFLIYQMVRRSQSDAVKRADLTSIKPISPHIIDRVPPTTGVRFGDRVIYRQTWRLLGQSLGDLVYSLPLAPLESVNLAIVEWSREDVAQRNETTTAIESLLHAQFRDRSVIDTVATAVSEYQGGFSVIGAAAGAGPGVGAIGGGTSHSWGNRNLVGESVQTLSDAVQQASELVRSQTSTVVIQSSQAERDALQTRTVSNYNQNHALTIQYYEVLRHFEVVTAFEAVEPVLLVPFLPLRFDRETALRFRRIIERNALDLRIRDWLDASERLGYSGNYPVPEPAPNNDDNTAGETLAPRLIERMEVKYITGNQTTVGNVKLELGLREGRWVLADEVASQHGTPPVLVENTELVSDVDIGDAISVDPSTVERVRVKWTQNGLQDGWKFKGLEIRYALEGGNGLESVPLFTKTAVDTLRIFEWTSTGTWTSEIDPPQPTASAQARVSGGSPPTRTLISGRLTGLLRRIGIAGPLSTAIIPGTNSANQQRKLADDAAQEMLLLEHLNANRLHYSRAVMMQMDGDERLRLLELVLGDTDLLRDIGFEPVGVSGHYVAFPYSGDRAPALDKAVLFDLKRTRPQTRHINLPTRGVFAETHLSNCPAREERDPSRMYSPSETILPTAPAITGVQPGSRNDQTDTTPTPLPSSVVNIQNPAPAPDPAGLAAAFGLLGQMGPFRDMSTSREVASLLGQLSSGAIRGGGVAPAAQRIQQALLDGVGNSGGGGNFRAHPAVSASPHEIFDRMKLLDQSGLPQSVRDRIQSNILDPGAAGDVVNAGLVGELGTDELPENIDFWGNLILHQVPISINQALDQRGLVVQDFLYAEEDIELFSSPINLDNYEVLVERMPIDGSGNEISIDVLFQELRREFNSVVKNPNLVGENPFAGAFLQLQVEGILDYPSFLKAVFLKKFSQADFSSHEAIDLPVWESNNPLGAVMRFDTYADDMGVVVSEFTSDHWIFSTIRDKSRLPLLGGSLGSHPVSGNRQFGFFKNSDNKFVLFAKGADRSTGKAETALSKWLTFSAGETLWLSFQVGIKKLIESKGGQATILMPFSKRFKFRKVIEHFRGISI